MEIPPQSLSPEQILRDPLLNKGTAFSQYERDLLHLHGFLPYHVSTLEEQVQRSYQNFTKRRTELGKHIFLSSLQNRNEVLFYKMIEDRLEEMLPLIYTPTVGDASLQFSLLYTHSRGIYFSYPLKDKIEEIVDSIPRDEIDIIVVTDGERILGLGDLGSSGMPIPVGKLTLYTLFGGIHPARCLPILLDVGTNNQELLQDPLYLGWRNQRVKDQEYYDFIGSFVKAIKKRYPKVLLQWEDFGGRHAANLLSKYRKEICSFNDDIQGTAAVVLAGILAAVKAGESSLAKQKIIIFGGGSAGMGIAQQLFSTMIENGLPKEDAYSNFYIIDREGLLHDGMTTLHETQKRFARNFSEVSSWGKGSSVFLEDVIRQIHPTILIGVSAQSGAFTEVAIKEMAKHVARPIIFPLSNPTSKAECSAEDVIRWTEGKAILATGSPFPPVDINGKKFEVAQCNNVYIFPGLGLGVIASGSREVSDLMFHKAAEVLSEHSPILQNPAKPLFPGFTQLKGISKKIAFEVGIIAQEEGFADKISSEELSERINAIMWAPHYER
ncbi:MAG: NAD-dependent malic enzyme [Chlamydiae bacterium]|nr:NAD-dependent malic enzyme [Chlamydiota bacterium]